MSGSFVWLMGVALLLTLSEAARPMRHRRPLMSIPLDRLNDVTTPGTANCTEKYFTQRLDHFSYAPPSDTGGVTFFQQRYYVCQPVEWVAGNPIFFYTGNEADVDLFVNMTGLMWENAPTFGAMLVFAEHRYFGKSLPFENPTPRLPELRYLTTDQALADYAELIYALRRNLSSDGSAVIGFGGSYGGMLCTWLRTKFPSALDGCIAGSAPVINFEDMDPPFDVDAFAETVTFDASSAGGSTDACKANIRQSWTDIQNFGQHISGQWALQSLMNLCKAPGMQDIPTLMAYASGAFGNMAMSSYPYPSGYLLLGGKGTLPAYPMRVACDHLSRSNFTVDERLRGFGKAFGVFYNHSKTLQCFDIHQDVNRASEIVDYLWGYLSCTTMVMPDGQNGVTDMFYPMPWNITQEIEWCQEQFPNVFVDPSWVKVNYGGYAVARDGSNIVFSNGELDPWSRGGILNSTNPRITTVFISDVGHHIDLMFSNPKDTPSIRDARNIEVSMIAQWIQEKQASLRP